MTALDWTVITIYLAGLITLAALLARKQKNQQDYYLAGRKTRWWQSGFSTMATQLSAISFISAPAFVALKEGGGLKWLCYEFGVPLGLIVVIIFIIPVLHREGYISIYEYLERRFNRETRCLVSILFQMGRGLATAVAVLAGGLILSTVLPITTVQAIIVIGAVTIIYDAIGGIGVVIISDVIQMIIIVVGIVVCGGAALRLVGWSNAWETLAPERLSILDFKHWGIHPDGHYSFWPMALGGIFLYASYYGCDQSQVQRELSVGNVHDVRKSLLFNAFGRYPIVLMYCLVGVFVGAVFMIPHTFSQVASNLQVEPSTLSEVLRQDPDRMVPMFVLAFLPPGVVGIVFIAVLSALMSSLDSAINSLSAVTMEDFYKVYIKPEATEKHYLRVSKILTVFWGIFSIVAALVFAGISGARRQTTIVLINAVGSLLYGPILAAFLLGLMVRRIGPFHAFIGVLSGIITNILVWRLTEISWLWWNLTGFTSAALVALLMSFIVSREVDLTSRNLTKSFRDFIDGWKRSYNMVMIYFVLIILVAYLIQRIA